ncbi:ABC transporter ATP-binding protein [Parahaliea mediterranea]|uniref:ABC transporter ATP-binding protein n=1 Tax=Parahaliea mediterranea TaxID=651086 RepID=UPI0019D428BF|nr:ABC transporter ATP-binding protein [Parahaliea mediterranea]
MALQLVNHKEGEAAPVAAAGRNGIELAGVSKIFGQGESEVTALSDVSFSIRDSEFVSVIGPSGCGKSTLLRILAGLIPYERGSVQVAGEPVHGALDPVGVVFQTSNLLPWLNVEENLTLALRVNGSDASAEQRAAMLGTLGLTGFEKRYPHELSGGMRHRVAIGQALIRDPAVLLMDEPFGALDALTRDHLNMELLRIWQARKKTVVLITHSISEAVLLSDRVLVLSERPGRLIEDVSIDLPRPRDPSDTREDPRFGDYIVQLSELMGVR